MKLKKFNEFDINESYSRPKGGEITYSFEAELGDAESGYEIYDVEMEVSYIWEDAGIGHYEFGGAKGYDSRVYAEIDEFKIISAKRRNENGDLEDVELTDELCNDLKDYAYENEMDNIDEKLDELDDY